MSALQLNKTMVKPSIMIRVFPHDGFESKLREVQAGMEEEGVPCSLATAGQADAVLLAYEGAGDSELGVGVGISATGICIHHYKLPVQQPLFVCEEPENQREWRRFGYNAARLVKGLPFKDRQAFDFPSELYEYVRDIVLRVMQEREVNAWTKMP